MLNSFGVEKWILSCWIVLQMIQGQEHSLSYSCNPKLEYDSSVWNPHRQCNIDKIEMVSPYTSFLLWLLRACFRTEQSTVKASLFLKYSRGGSRGRVQGVHPPPAPWDDLWFSNITGILQKNYVVIGVEVEQETSALSPKKNPGSAPL